MRAVLDREGCIFTIPIIVARLTRRRKGLRPSSHGSSANPADFLVHTEYGADFWTEILQAGYSECRISSPGFPRRSGHNGSAVALVGRRSQRAGKLKFRNADKLKN